MRPAFDTAHGYNPGSGMAIRDGARQSGPDRSRYKAVAEAHKNCLACPHWDLLHPGHGKCRGYTYSGAALDPSPCAGFVDPEVGRPDRVYTRDQVDRMLRYRWEAVKDRIYLLRDGRYGLWDEWSSEEWKAKPGQRFTF